jgi:transketolase
MRSIPGMTVIVPADAHDAAAAVRAVAEFLGPVYIRLTRDKFPVLYNETRKFEIGKATVHKKGADVTFIACGLLTHEAMSAAQKLSEKGISAGVIDMGTIKPLDEAAVLEAARESGAIVTAEEHSIMGGLGSAVAETVSSHRPAPVVRVGIPDTYLSSGTPEELMEAAGLTPDHLVEAAHRAIALKKRPGKI